jgi:outer membrane protein assembly factor BamB
MPQQVGPEDPMYKYLNHVPVTEYEWRLSEGDKNWNRFSPSPTAPTTDHLLWMTSLARYGECLQQTGAIFNGKVMVRSNSGKSLYPPVTYALDQNTGKIIWSIPASLQIQKYDDTHVFSTNRVAIDPDTGEALYTLNTLPEFYDPVLKMGWGDGPGFGPLGAPTIAGYDWPDLNQEPTLAWVSDVTGNAGGILAYNNGKVFSFGDTTSFQLTCYDARTGEILWTRWLPVAVGLYTRACGFYNEGLFLTTYSGIYCFSQETGDLLWKRPGLECGAGIAIAYGKIYFYETRTYLHCLDATDGHVVWRYAPTRKIPHLCGQSGPGDCNHTMHHHAYYRCAVAAGKIYATTMQKTTYGTLLPPNYPGVEYEGVNYWVNPNPFPVIAHTGANEFVCLDAETGEVIWRVAHGWPYGPNAGTIQAPAYAGPDMGHTIMADGKVYGIEETYSCHTSIGRGRPETDPLARYPESIPKYHLSHDWYTGRVYCFGPGPVQMTVSTDLTTASSGQTVKISGTAVDMSPASPLTPAAKLPIHLSYMGEAQGSIGTVTTNVNGEFSFNWAPSTAGTYTIVASSEGSDSYEAPQDVSTTITVSGGITLSTAGSIAVIVAITVSAAAITVPIRKRKHEGDEHLEA